MVDNCPECNKIYQRNQYGKCLDCRRLELQRLEKFHDYMKRNRKATMQDVCSSTGLSQALIHRFIREGRILLSDFVNLTYPCDSCGAPIRQHKLCTSCSIKIRNDIDRMMQSEKKSGTRKSVGYQIRN